MARITGRGLVALLMTLLILAACGTTGTAGPDTTDTVGPTSLSPEVTAAIDDDPLPTTRVEPAATTSTAPQATSTTESFTVLDEAEGSGCTPGSGGLPDGEWFGYLVAAEEEAVEFDLACWFIGEAAARAAREDRVESPPPNDYYVRNVNSMTRLLDVRHQASVVWYPQSGDSTSATTVAYTDWLVGTYDRGSMPGVWVEVGDGRVVAIHEQWVP